ncbi:hypothetical protein WJX73_003385 [Symbiochloris irregularis]|uniref:Uncharacterized protein n=1 Tax=Symbiochloris irregularis TaxID=706552 RepID=A0AAW1NL35_9CHLO
MLHGPHRSSWDVVSLDIGKLCQLSPAEKNTEFSDRVHICVRRLLPITRWLRARAQGINVSRWPTQTAGKSCLRWSQL